MTVHETGVDELGINHTNDTLEMTVLGYSKACMNHIWHYRVLPWATGPLTSLESVAC